MNHFQNIAWRPGFNDPEPMGWIAFAAYGVASALCIRAALRRGDRESKLAWLLLGAALGLAGLNLQLDLHVLLVQWGRRIAESQGWYENRRLFQRAFMVVFSGVLVVGVIFTARRFRGFARAQKLAMIGALMIIGYVFVRNASFNHISDRAGAVWHMKDGLHLMDLAGVAAIGISAWRYSRSSNDR